LNIGEYDTDDETVSGEKTEKSSFAWILILLFIEGTESRKNFERIFENNIPNQ
jgi:hypothetical protein